MTELRIALLALITLIAIALLLLFPKADLAIAHNYFLIVPTAPERHGFAHYQWTGWVRTSFIWIKFLPYVIGALLFVLMWYKAFFRLKYSWRSLVYLLLCLAVGVYGMVSLTKEITERPRPKDTMEFGGAYHYMPPLTIGQENGHSGASGHAAVGFYLISFALLARKRALKIAFYAAGIVAGSWIGWTRIMAGGHYVGDILLTFLIILWTSHLLAWIMWRTKKTSQGNHA